MDMTKENQHHNAGDADLISMGEEKITEENIRIFVNYFYTKVRADENLGPVFLQAIGPSSEEWEPHLQKMYDFWSSIMLGSGRYYGNPFQKHLELPAFDISLFNQWLSLFEETAYQVYIERIAIQYIERSQRIARNFKLGLYGIVSSS